MAMATMALQSGAGQAARPSAKKRAGGASAAAQQRSPPPPGQNFFCAPGAVLGAAAARAPPSAPSPPRRRHSRCADERVALPLLGVGEEAARGRPNLCTSRTAGWATTEAGCLATPPRRWAWPLLLAAACLQRRRARARLACLHLPLGACRSPPIVPAPVGTSYRAPAVRKRLQAGRRGARRMRAKAQSSLWRSGCLGWLGWSAVQVYRCALPKGAQDGAEVKQKQRTGPQEESACGKTTGPPQPPPLTSVLPDCSLAGEACIGIWERRSTRSVSPDQQALGPMAGSLASQQAQLPRRIIKVGGPGPGARGLASTECPGSSRRQWLLLD